jgi:uncharacterized protein
VFSGPKAVRIVDAHCHAGVGDGLSGPWDTRASLADYLPRATAAGIRHTVLLPVFTSDYAAANRQLAAVVARDPGRRSGLAMVHPTRDAGRVGGMIEEAVQRLGLRGIKVHRHDAPLSRETCEAAMRWHLPILYDVMGDVGHVELLAREYPRLRLIIPHLGSFGDAWRAQVSLISLLERHPNVYADTSGVRRFDVLLEAARRAPEKLLYGSDGPWLHPGIELAKVAALGLAPHVHAQVVGGNAKRLFGLGMRSARRSRALSATSQPGHRARHGDAPPASPVPDPWLEQETAPE